MNISNDIRIIRNRFKTNHTLRQAHVAPNFIATVVMIASIAVVAFVAYNYWQQESRTYQDEIGQLIRSFDQK